MFTEKELHTVAAATWTRYDKWRVELEIAGEPKRVCWLSPAQYDYLTSAFEHTKNGYSDKTCTVYGYFDEKGYYVKCKAVLHPPKQRHFTPPVSEHSEVVQDELRDAN